MTTTFSDFLREQAEKHQAEVQAGKATVEEWSDAVQRLFGQMRAWLSASDPSQIIQIKEGTVDITEPGLGRYKVPRLDLRAFGKWIGIIPKARTTVGSATPRNARRRSEQLAAWILPMSCADMSCIGSGRVTRTSG